MSFVWSFISGYYCLENLPAKLDGSSLLYQCQLCQWVSVLPNLELLSQLWNSVWSLLAGIVECAKHIQHSTLILWCAWIEIQFFDLFFRFSVRRTRQRETAWKRECVREIVKEWEGRFFPIWIRCAGRVVDLGFCNLFLLMDCTLIQLWHFNQHSAA